MDIFVEHWRSSNHGFSIGASEEQNGGQQLIIAYQERTFLNVKIFLYL